MDKEKITDDNTQKVDIETSNNLDNNNDSKKKENKNNNSSSEVIVPDSSELAAMHLHRLGVILFNLTLCIVIISFASFFAGIMGFIIGFIGLLIMFLTLFAVLADPNYWSTIKNVMGSSAEIISITAKIMPIIAPFGLGLSICSLVAMCFDKKQRSVARIVFAVAFILIMLFRTIASFSGLTVLFGGGN